MMFTHTAIHKIYELQLPVEWVVKGGEKNDDLMRGIVCLPEKVGAEDLANSLLRHELLQWQGKPVAVYALTETRLLPAKTQRFIEFLYGHLM